MSRNNTSNAPDSGAERARLRVLSDEDRRMSEASQAEISRAVEELVGQAKAGWAGEIHDGLTQTVIAAVLELESLARLDDPDAEVVRNVLEKTSGDLRKSLADIRGVLFELTEPADAVTSFDEIVDEIANRWEISPDVRIVGNLDGVPPAVEHAAQVVMREALTNAAKHAGSKHVSVRVIVTGDDVHIQIEDHGRGMADHGDGDTHFGMRMMRRRVEELGGRLVVHSDSQHGTLVDAHLPSKRESER
jgi:two-component system sensor histidine kinase DevS